MLNFERRLCGIHLSFFCATPPRMLHIVSVYEENLIGQIEQKNKEIGIMTCLPFSFSGRFAHASFVVTYSLQLMEPIVKERDCVSSNAWNGVILYKD